jgi:hypothetical protein
MFVLFSSPPCVLHAPPIHLPWFGHPNNIWWWVQIIELRVVQLVTASCHFIPSLPVEICNIIILPFVMYSCETRSLS